MSPTIIPQQLAAAADDFRVEVINGLSRRPRRLPCKYLYDQRGSQLFDRICELPEYYPTRTELSIMREFGSQIAEAIGPRATLIELGSGSSQKTRLLLDSLPALSMYVPVDISRKHLHETCLRLSRAYPEFKIEPVCGDFTRHLDLTSSELLAGPPVVYFPGSTIGNLTRGAAQRLLGRIARMAGQDGSLLIGIDLVKDRDVLKAAYNDARGVTAAFNLNLLARINRELAGNLDLNAFRHLAIYNGQRRRIEMHLASLRDQSISLAGQQFQFELGETICTEYSHKYTIPQFVALAAPANLRLRRYWTDRRHWFAVLYFTVD